MLLKIAKLLLQFLDIVQGYLLFLYIAHGLISLLFFGFRYFLLFILPDEFFDPTC